MGLATGDLERLGARAQRLKKLFGLIEKHGGNTEEWYHGEFLNARAVRPRTWEEHLADVKRQFDIVSVIDPEISNDFEVLYVRDEWRAIQNAREEKRVREMKSGDYLKLTAFEG